MWRRGGDTRKAKSHTEGVVVQQPSTHDERIIQQELYELVTTLKQKIADDGKKRKKNKQFQADYDRFNSALKSNDFEIMRETLLDYKISNQLVEDQHREEGRVKILSVIGPSKSAAMQQEEFSKAIKARYFAITTKFGNGTMDRYDHYGVEFEVYHMHWQDVLERRHLFARCFGNRLDGIVFSASLAAYDEIVTTPGGGQRNQIMELLSLFRSLTDAFPPENNAYLLFLTDKEEFAEKLQSVDICSGQPDGSFQDYAGGKDFDQGAQYFIDKFMKEANDGALMSWAVHVIDILGSSDGLDFLLDTIRNILMAEDLRRAGFLAH